MPNQTPDTTVTGLTKPLDYPGNSVIVQIAPTVWAVYAHALPGTVAVKPGDHVEKGQVIAKLGNSGNSGAPHLHFQLSDGPDPIDSHSVPFALESYWLAGASILQTFPPTIPTARWRRYRSAAHPVNRPVLTR